MIHLTQIYKDLKHSNTTLRLVWHILERNKKKEERRNSKENERAYGTKCSQAVTHPSTDVARPCLTSVIRREPVYSRWYGRRRKNWRIMYSFVGETQLVLFVQKLPTRFHSNWAKFDKFCALNPIIHQNTRNALSSVASVFFGNCFQLYTKQWVTCQKRMHAIGQSSICHLTSWWIRAKML